MPKHREPPPSVFDDDPHPALDDVLSWHQESTKAGDSIIWIDWWPNKTVEIGMIGEGPARFTPKEEVGIAHSLYYAAMCLLTAKLTGSDDDSEEPECVAS